MAWQPTIIRFRIESFQTAAETVLVSTNAGAGYLKALGNPGGPHRLAADWVGTPWPLWLGLPTFDYAIIQVRPENEIAFYHGNKAQPGPAFITRKDPGMTWGGDAGTLAKLINPEDVGKLVLFDTRVRNVDHYHQCPDAPTESRQCFSLQRKCARRPMATARHGPYPLF